MNNAWILYKKNNPAAKVILRDFILVSESLIKTNNKAVKQFNFSRDASYKITTARSTTTVTTVTTSTTKIV